MEAALRDQLQRPDLAALLRRVQEAERNKLQLTVSLQSLKRAHALSSFSWQRHPDAPSAAAAADMPSIRSVSGAASLVMEAAAALRHAGSAGSSSSANSMTNIALASLQPGMLQEAAAALGMIHQQQQQQAVAQTAHRHHGTCGCSGGDHAAVAADTSGLGHDADEPTEAEFEAAVAEARLEIDAAVTAINDVLEEVRYELAEAAQTEDGAVE